MLRYLSLDIICSSKLTVFLELRSRKTVRFSEQIMSADKYLSIFSRQMRAIVYLLHLSGNTCAVIGGFSKYNEDLTTPVFWVCTVSSRNLFFSTSIYVLRTRAMNWSGKHNLQHGPRTRLVKDTHLFTSRDDLVWKSGRDHCSGMRNIQFRFPSVAKKRHVPISSLKCIIQVR